MQKKLRKLTTFIFCLLSVLYSQTVSPSIPELIDQVNIDNLIRHVRILSGEESVRINRVNTTITSRQLGHLDHDMAAEYLKATFKEYGYSPAEQQFYRGDAEICNLLATHRGKQYPNQKYILCAHYDSINLLNNEPAPGANDNASGIAAVLEAARILKNIETDYTIVFALWDAEEKGLWGSEYYAFNAARDNDTIRGVINLDMIAYDPDDKQLFSINIDDFANSIDLGNSIYSISNTYIDSLQPMIYYPGSTQSDHRKFWEHGYSAVFIGEAFRDGADYPFNHYSTDTIDKFNFKFFHNMSKLALATITVLANIHASDIEDILNDFILEQNYPNPFNASTVIRYSLPHTSYTTLILYNLIGEEVFVLVQKVQPSGTHQIHLNVSDLPTGVYLYRLQQKENISSRSMLLIK